MDFIKELHNLARKGMRIMRNCPPEKNCRKLLWQEERKEIYIESLDPTRTKFQAGTQYLSKESDLVRFQDTCKEASCTVGEATIPENHRVVTDGIPVFILPKHMIVFTKGLKSKEHNGQWGPPKTKVTDLLFQDRSRGMDQARKHKHSYRYGCGNEGTKMTPRRMKKRR